MNALHEAVEAAMASAGEDAVAVQQIQAAAVELRRKLYFLPPAPPSPPSATTSATAPDTPQTVSYVQLRNAADASRLVHEAEQGNTEATESLALLIGENESHTSAAAAGTATETSQSETNLLCNETRPADL